MVNDRPPQGDLAAELVSGFDFADVVNAYWEGHESHDEARQAAALRWLHGEFSTKTEARQALGVRSIIDDDGLYDYMKLYARFVRLAGAFAHRVACG